MGVNTRTGPKVMVPDFAAIRSVVSPPQDNFCARARVGHFDPDTGQPENNPAYARIEQGQVLVEVTIEGSLEQQVARLALPDAGNENAVFFALDFGCRVLVEYPDGDPQRGVITGRLHDARNAFPNSVAGVQTGAQAASQPEAFVPAPSWSFIKTKNGQLIAIESGSGGDVLIHAGANVEVKAQAAVCIDSPQVHLGKGFMTAPVGGRVGPSGVDIPGVPAVPPVPQPWTMPSPAAPGPALPFVGFAESIIRAKDLYQSDVTVDPYFWAMVIALYANPLVGSFLPQPMPLALTSRASGVAGPGSLHTAADPT
jgi:hypothetical protein